jgi:hypothetical protein
MRTLTRHSTPLLALLLAALLLTVIPTPAADAATFDAGFENRFVDHINADRVRRGLDRLVVRSDLRRSARQHTTVMADRNDLHHNPNLARSVDGWQLLAENVGRGPSVTSLHDAFMASSGHRANILNDRVEQVGIGVVTRGNTVWVTVVFRKPSRPWTPRWRDVSARTPQRKAIARLTANEIADGCGGRRFCPDKPAKRAAVASALARAAAINPIDNVPFADVNPRTKHAGNIAALAHAGIMPGCRADDFCPGRAVRRKHLARFLNEAVPALQRHSSSRSFGDVQRSFVERNAARVVAAGIIKPCKGGDGFCPHRKVKRRQLAAILTRAFDL